jgi:hypothetical protein
MKRFLAALRVIKLTGEALTPWMKNIVIALSLMHSAPAGQQQQSPAWSSLGTVVALVTRR